MARYWNLLSCRHFSEVASKKLDQPLTLWESFFFRFHHFICLVCRRFFRQIETVDQAAKGKLSEEYLASPNSPRLSPESQARIASQLREEIEKVRA